MHFPLFVDLTDKPCLVVGAGPVAARKVRILADFGARVTVIARENGACGVPICRPFQDSDIAGHTLVVAATDDAALNARIASLCRAARIPVNVVDDPANNVYPMALDAEDKDEVFVGRIRRDDTVTSGVNLWVVADNIRKGAATNAVQIAEIVAGL